MAIKEENPDAKCCVENPNENPTEMSTEISTEHPPSSDVDSKSEGNVPSVPAPTAEDVVIVTSESENSPSIHIQTSLENEVFSQENIPPLNFEEQ